MNYFNLISLYFYLVLDSTGKHQDGLLRGNGHVMGHFDQCLDVQIPAFQGQYCTVFWLPYLHNEADAIRDRSVTTILSILGLLTNQTTQPVYLEPNPYTYMLPSQAFCLPSTCNSEDLKLAFADLIGSYLLANYSIVTVTNSDYCFTQETISSAPAFDTSDITVIVLLSSIGLVVIVSTACHWRLQQKATEIKSKLLHILLSFSLLINVRKLLSTKKAPDSIPCLHGIRVLSTTWIVLAHTYSQVKSQFNQNIVGMKQVRVIQ
jgi:Nose resistant-to-fluoxetine protein, N-terminal domain